MTGVKAAGLRASFNSLFEMPKAFAEREEKKRKAFNSLFEMRSTSRRWADTASRSFNSLFEMPPYVETAGLCGSIRYFQFSI